jgi:hypothetical protein
MIELQRKKNGEQEKDVAFCLYPSEPPEEQHTALLESDLAVRGRKAAVAAGEGIKGGSKQAE